MQKGFTLIEFFIVIVIMGLLLFIAFTFLNKSLKKNSSEKTDNAQTQPLNQTESARLAEFSNRRDVPIKNLIFYREPRVPDLCVAYSWVGYADGGPVAFEVNCEKVDGLLINPSPPEGKTTTKPACPPDCDQP